jgi:hypothetical protein
MTTKEVISVVKWLCRLQDYFADQSTKHLQKFNDKGNTPHQQDMYQLICEQYRAQVARVDHVFSVLDADGDNYTLPSFTHYANDVIFNIC